MRVFPFKALPTCDFFNILPAAKAENHRLDRINTASAEINIAPYLRTRDLFHLKHMNFEFMRLIPCFREILRQSADFFRFVIRRRQAEINCQTLAAVINLIVKRKSALLGFDYGMIQLPHGTIESFYIVLGDKEIKAHRSAVQIIPRMYRICVIRFPPNNEITYY